MLIAKPAYLFSTLAGGLLLLCAVGADGTFERLSQASNRADRLAQGRLPTPSLALVDAQSVKLAPRLGQQRAWMSTSALMGASARYSAARVGASGASCCTRLMATTAAAHSPCRPTQVNGPFADGQQPTL